MVDAFSKLSTTSENRSIRLFAKKCKEYTLILDYKQECKNSYEFKKTQLADLEIERVLKLAQKGMHGAIGITDNSVSKVTKRTLSILNEDSYRDIREEEGRDDERKEGDEDSDDSDERVWRWIFDSPKRSVLDRPYSSQYTSEKLKLTLDMISKLEPL